MTCASPPQRVVVTGAGLVTALGSDWSANAEGFRTGKTAFRPVTLFDVSRQRVQQAAEVALPDDFPECRLTQQRLRRMDRAGRLLLSAAAQAWRQSGWEPSDALPIVLGTTSGGMALGEKFYRQAVEQPADRRRQPSRVAHYQPQRQALDIGDAFGFTGPVMIIANACASGANAIGHAWHAIRFGGAPRVLTGGYDALSQLVFAGFDALQALSPSTCRPFDRDRDGLALGEGAAVLALESLDSATRRGAAILGEIAGYGAATDDYHLTQPEPQGEAAWKAMQAACASAKVSPAQIQYLNAHGTGTPLNDQAEAEAINRWAAGSAPRLQVSSTKSAIGHLLGAAGAVETVVCLMALREQWLPPTTTTETVDPRCRFTLVQHPTPACGLEYALTNSFGFGGANASLVCRRWP